MDLSPEHMAAAASSAGGDALALSKKQRNKRLAREARQGRKGQKKARKQNEALETALAAMDAALPEAPAGGHSELNGGEVDAGHHARLRLRLCSAFNARGRYQELPQAFGPGVYEGLAALGKAVVRPPKYTAKFLPQEYSLLHKFWVLLGADATGAGILDIGAGNANCAVLAASLLGLTVLCVERESPREELRAEAQLPPALQARVIRLEADVADFGPAQLQEVAALHGLSRLILVAKHPCGIGVDRSIDCAARLQEAFTAAGAASTNSAAVPRLLGLVIATCCTNKLCFDDVRVSRVSEFCDFYAKDLPAFAAGGADGRARLERVVEVMSRCSAWRSAKGSDGNAILPEQLEWAELFEDVLQRLRLQRLGRLFGAVEEVRFAPSECTLQDRCLVATAASPLPAGVWAHFERGADPEFLALLAGAAARLLAETGPIDCRPKGLKSAKYDFDYTDLAPPQDD